MDLTMFTIFSLLGLLWLTNRIANKTEARLWLKIGGYKNVLARREQQITTLSEECKKLTGRNICLERELKLREGEQDGNKHGGNRATDGYS